MECFSLMIISDGRLIFKMAKGVRMIDINYPKLKAVFAARGLQVTKIASDMGLSYNYFPAVAGTKGKISEIVAGVLEIKYGIKREEYMLETNPEPKPRTGNEQTLYNMIYAACREAVKDVMADDQ